MPKSNKQNLIFLFLISFFALAICLFGDFLISPKIINLQASIAQLAQNTSARPATTTQEKPIEMIFVGDIMLDRGVEYQILKQNNWKWPFMKIADKLKEADITFGNLEGPISDKGTKVGSIYSFRADPRVMAGLSYAGFDVMSVANNHAIDYTKEALEDTFLRLKEANIDYVGGGMNATEAGTTLIKEIRGTKIAFLAYTNLCSASWKATKDKSGINCASLNDLEKIKKDIAKTKEQADIVVVSIHAGEEYTQELNQFQAEFTKAAVAAGADIIIGHHPHVVQKHETSGDSWIFYSLGNFVFDQSFSTSTMTGRMVTVSLLDKKINQVRVATTTISSEFQTELEK